MCRRRGSREQIEHEAYARGKSVINTLYTVSLRVDFLFFPTFLTEENSSEGRKMLRMQFDRECSLFYVELPGGTILLHTVKENEKFPAQFGREVRYFYISSLKNTCLTSFFF